MKLNIIQINIYIIEVMVLFEYIKILTEKKRLPITASFVLSQLVTGILYEIRIYIQFSKIYRIDQSVLCNIECSW